MAKSRKNKRKSRQEQSTHKSFGANVDSSRRGIAISEIKNLLKKGLELHNSGDYEAAKKYCQKAVELQPKNGEAWYLLGAISTALGNYQQAVQDLKRAIQLLPNEAEFYFHLGNAWYGLGEFELAIAAFRDALRLKPNHLDAKFNLGNMFLYLRQFSSALSTYQEVLDLNPNHFHTVNNLGHALFELERYDEAITAFEKTIELDPNYLDAYMHIGNVFQVQDRYEEAMALYERILKTQPQKAGVYNNIANILKKQAKYQEALTTYEKCVLLNPQDPEIHLNIALVLLLLGDFDRGWKEHEWRLNTARVIPKELKTPIWQGNSIHNEELLLWSEQGFGDSIQFIRYAILLQKQGFNLTVATRSPLLKLFKNCLEPSIKIIDQDQTNLSHYHNHNSLMGLPYLFQTNLETIPQATPYLFSEKNISTELQLPDTSSLKIGLVWAAGTVNKELYKSKSIELDQFLQAQQKILETQKVSFWSLQIGEDAQQIQAWLKYENIHDLSHHLKDFLDTANIINQLDLVITVDTAVAHLAGAMGKPVWVMLPFVPDWRWLLERSDSPWYPTMTLFRQSTMGDWQSVFQEIKIKLQQLIKQNKSSSKKISVLTQGISKKQTINPTLATSFHDAVLHYHLGEKLQAEGEFLEAIAEYKKSIELRPDQVEVYNAIGNAFNNIGNFHEAEKAFEQAINIDPQNPILHYNFGNMLLLQNKNEEAIIAYDKSLQLNPQNRDALNNRGHAFSALGKYDEARQSFEEILTFLPDDADSYNHIGSTFHQQERYEEAIHYFQQAYELKPENITIEYNLANGLRDIGDYSGAIQHYRHVLERDPQDKKTHYNLGWVLLLTGNYQEGWREHEWRFNPHDASDRLLPTPIWDGTIKQNQHLLLWSEQGFGDCIQFIRYLPLCLEQNQEVTVSTRSPLVRLFSECLDVKVRVIYQDQIENIESYTAHAPLMSLANIFESTEEKIPKKIPYIFAPKVIPDHLKLPSTKAKKIGIVWGSNAANSAMYQAKSIDLDVFFAVQKELIESEQISFFGLQVGEDAEKIKLWVDNKTIFDVSPLLKDFCDTASIIDQLDLVITIDTAVAHLAGAMGKSVWVMLPYTPDWRWLVDREDTPWYPTMQLFRQTNKGNWENVYENIYAQLTAELLLESFALSSQENMSFQIDNEDKNTVFYRNIANGLLEQGRLDEAIATYQKILEQNPNDYEIHKGLGKAYLSQNQFAIADQHFQQAIKLTSDNAELYFECGNAYFAHKKYHEAVSFYEQAIQLDASFLNAYDKLVNALLEQQKKSEAINVLENFVSITPDKASIYNQIGCLHYDQSNYQQAIAAFEKGLEFLPNNTALLYNRGNALQAIDENNAAILDYQNVLAQNPQDVNVLFNYGCVLQKQEKFGDAVIKFREVLKIQPDHKGAQCNLGFALQANQQTEAAIEEYRKLISLDPTNADNHCNLAISLLINKDFKNGWKEYEWRLKKFPALNSFDIWQGRSLKSGEILLLWSEQGFGDSLQFVRYAALFYAKGYIVKIATSKPLIRLFEKCLQCPSEIINIDQDDLSGYENHIPLASLPKFFQTSDETIPALIPYINPPTEISPHLKLPNISGKKIGLVWASGAGNANYKIRTLNLSLLFGAFSDLFDSTQVSFWSLQVGKDATQIQPWLHHSNVNDLSPLLKDFYDTASVIQQLDLVITVDTAVAHLAGAMGKPVWILLPFVPDWRWQLDREDSPWYPTARLFRQPKRNDWLASLLKIRKALHQEFNLELPPENWMSNISEENEVVLNQNGAAFYIDLGQSLAEQGKIDEAIATYEKALLLEPRNVDLLNRLAVIFYNQSNYDSAAAYFIRAIAVQEDNPDLYYNLGTIYLIQKKHQEAIDAYEKVLKLNPSHGGTLHNISIALTAEHQYEKALEYLKKSQVLDPSNADTLCQIGNVLCEQKSYEQAIQYFQQALYKKPNTPGLLYNIATCYQYWGRHQEAIQYYEKTLRLEPHNHAAQYNLGNALQDMCRFEESIEAYRKAIAIDANNAGVHLNLGLLLLLTGNFEQGWSEYEWRFDPLHPELKTISTPMWDGQPIEDELLVWYEQGMGDSIQFIRYLEVLQEKGIKVIVSTAQPLIKLFKNCLKTPITVLNQESEDFSANQYKYHVSLMSLPHILKTRANSIPNAIPYILPPQLCKSELILPTVSGKKIGIVWASGTANTGLYARKSIDISLLLRYLQDAINNQLVSVWSLQVGQDSHQIQPWVDNQSIFDPTPFIEDFYDTASIIKQLDLIITVDTSVAHLAGAMGKAVWLMLPFVPDWRWQLERHDSPWYPTVRIFRQHQKGDWNSLLREIKQELNKILLPENHPQYSMEHQDLQVISPNQQSKKVTINIIASFQGHPTLGHTGFNIHASHLSAELNELTANENNISILISDLSDMEQIKQNHKILNDRSINEDIVNIGILSGYDCWDHLQSLPGIKIVYAVWESTKLPDGWTISLNKCDYVWTPSQWGKQVFIENGVMPEKIFVVPEGVNSKLFHPEISVDRNLSKDPRFKFFTVGKCETRKSIAELIHAFDLEFYHDPNVVLVLACDNPFIPAFNMKAFVDNLWLRNYEKFIYISRQGSYQNLAQIMNSCHCGVFPTKAEAWGLPIIESMALGKPTIVTNYSGITEYANSRNAILLDYYTIPVQDIGLFFYRTDDDYGTWALPNTLDLRHKMRSVYQEYDKYYQQSLLSSSKLREDWSWKMSAQKVLDLVFKLSQN